MAKKRRLLAGIDVGTTKICATIAELDDKNIEILGTGLSPSRGLSKGIVVNLSETIESVRDSLEQAEKQSDTVVESAFVSVGGTFLRSVNSSGRTEVKGKNGEVTLEDIGRAVADAQRFDIPEEYEIIHVLTQSFKLDGHNGIINPVGMTGRNLSVNLHLVLNAAAVVQNIVNAINKAGVVVNGVVMQQLASAEAVLTEDEKELGTILVDIGGGTTDVAAYVQGSIRHSQVIPMGGSLITKDIAIGLKAPLDEAEELKRHMANVFPESVPEEEIIEVGEVGTGHQRTMSRRMLCEIVQARCDEILTALRKIIKRMGVQSDLLTGVVLTGGGSLLDGLVERTEQFLEVPVRLGYPINIVTPDHETYHPAFSTGLGLLKYAQNIQGEQVARAARKITASRPRGASERVKNWIFEKIS